MPIFEYVCKECEHEFEALVFGKQKAECPKCQSKKLDGAAALSVCRFGEKRTDDSAVDGGGAVRVVRRRSRARGLLAQGSRLSYLLAIHSASHQTSGRAPSAATYPRKNAITRPFSR